jgi:hypothetical protein
MQALGGCCVCNKELLHSRVGCAGRLTTAYVASMLARLTILASVVTGVSLLARISVHTSPASGKWCKCNESVQKIMSHIFQHTNSPCILGYQTWLSSHHASPLTFQVAPMYSTKQASISWLLDNVPRFSYPGGPNFIGNCKVLMCPCWRLLAGCEAIPLVPFTLYKLPGVRQARGLLL